MSHENSSSRHGARQPLKPIIVKRVETEFGPTRETRQAASLREGQSRYWGASNFWRPESRPLSANVTVNGFRKVKFSTVSEGS
jgi:hypothetical protein